MGTDDQISVLICEDSRVVGIALKSTVEKAGCRVSGVVRSAEAALAFIAKEPPDIVLMDIGLPDLSGFEIASKCSLPKELVTHELRNLPLSDERRQATTNTMQPTQ